VTKLKRKLTKDEIEKCDKNLKFRRSELHIAKEYLAIKEFEVSRITPYNRSREDEKNKKEIKIMKQKIEELTETITVTEKQIKEGVEVKDNPLVK